MSNNPKKTALQLNKDSAQFCLDVKQAKWESFQTLHLNEAAFVESELAMLNKHRISSDMITSTLMKIIDQRQENKVFL